MRLVMEIMHGVFFFFQAEDGIRDLTVTGVQTCALPISCGFGASLCAASSDTAAVRRAVTVGPSRIRRRSPVATSKTTTRSEERRGGEEGRSRWSPYH